MGITEAFVFSAAILGVGKVLKDAYTEFVDGKEEVERRREAEKRHQARLQRWGRSRSAMTQSQKPPSPV
ncbi:MAG: hypothetical protein FWF24_00515 [Alphaproteobacteria bacterium]|nr:hypothetical protein [Alphaproteobacteria bacterium]